MCGICGSFKIHLAKSQLVAMTDYLNHRGPDDAGVYFNSDHQIGLGHTRLSIIDVSVGGHQPMISKDKRFVIVFNGEIYNYRELRNRLAAHFIFYSNSDTEVLLNAYRHWGIDCLNELVGMFAFAIYDTITCSLFIARDRVGEKPLYYHRGSSGILFSSEIRSILKSGLVNPELNYDVLSEFLSSQTVHPPETLIREVFMLEAGHYMMITATNFVNKKYWSPEVRTSTDSKETACKKVRELFISSVERQLVSDVPLGAFLSGGIDSTILVGIAASVSKNKFNTYTVAFDDQDFKDGYYAKIAANCFNTNHHEIKLTMEDVLNQVPAALNAFDHPTADGINSYIVSGAVRRSGVRVALSGIGGDEVFGGYSSFKVLNMLHKRQMFAGLLPKFIRAKLASSFVSNGNSVQFAKILEYLKSDLGMLDNYKLTRKFLFDNQINCLGHALPQSSSAASEGFETRSSYSAVSKLEIQNYLHDVLLRDTDQMSMAHALEVRAPFLDYRLIEYVLGLPNDFKIDKKINKSLFVQALSEFIPKELVHRPKQGFAMPFDRWMRTELNSFCVGRLKYLKDIELFNRVGIDLLWSQFLLRPKSVSWSRIWLLVSLSNWIEKNGIVVSRAR